jgi:hypothetical protein
LFLFFVFFSDPLRSGKERVFVAKMSVDELQEQIDIEDEMNGEEDDSDTDADLLIQALRERLRAAAYLQLLGQKLPFGFHFGLTQPLPPASEAFKKAGDAGSTPRPTGLFPCSEKGCGAKFSTR